MAASAGPFDDPPIGADDEHISKEPEYKIPRRAMQKVLHHFRRLLIETREAMDLDSYKECHFILNDIQKIIEST